MSDPEESPTLGEVMLSFMDSLGAVKSAVIGYRHDLVEAGFDPDAADTMTIDLHSYFMDVLRSPYTGGGLIEHHHYHEEEP